MAIRTRMTPMAIPAVSPAESSVDALLSGWLPPPLSGADGLEVGDAVAGAGVGVVVAGAAVGDVVVGIGVGIMDGAGVGVVDGFCDGADDAGETVGKNVSPRRVGYVVVGAEVGAVVVGAVVVGDEVVGDTVVGAVVVGAVVVGDEVVGDTVVGEDIDGADSDGAAEGATGALPAGRQYTPPTSVNMVPAVTWTAAGITTRGAAITII
jgi:hypothetical protein